MAVMEAVAVEKNADCAKWPRNVQFERVVPMARGEVDANTGFLRIGVFLASATRAFAASANAIFCCGAFWRLSTFWFCPCRRLLSPLRLL